MSAFHGIPTFHSTPHEADDNCHQPPQDDDDDESLVIVQLLTAVQEQHDMLTVTLPSAEYTAHPPLSRTTTLNTSNQPIPPAKTPASSSLIPNMLGDILASRQRSRNAERQHEDALCPTKKQRCANNSNPKTRVSSMPPTAGEHNGTPQASRNGVTSSSSSTHTYTLPTLKRDVLATLLPQPPASDHARMAAAISVWCNTDDQQDLLFYHKSHPPLSHTRTHDGSNVITLQRLRAEALREACHDTVRYTNYYRHEHRKPALFWDGQLAAIAYVHAKHMGLGKAPFTHHGVKKRFLQYPFPYTLAAENLYMDSGTDVYSIARCAVDGWINSPGHRRNLLRDTQWCGIGIYVNEQGVIYVTQLFASYK